MTFVQRTSQGYFATASGRLQQTFRFHLEKIIHKIITNTAGLVEIWRSLSPLTKSIMILQASLPRESGKMVYTMTFVDKYHADHRFLLLTKRNLRPYITAPPYINLPTMCNLRNRGQSLIYSMCLLEKTVNHYNRKRKPWKRIAYTLGRFECQLTHVVSMLVCALLKQDSHITACCQERLNHRLLSWPESCLIIPFQGIFPTNDGLLMIKKRVYEETADLMWRRRGCEWLSQKPIATVCSAEQVNRCSLQCRASESIQRRWHWSDSISLIEATFIGDHACKIMLCEQVNVVCTSGCLTVCKVQMTNRHSYDLTNLMNAFFHLRLCLKWL